MGLKIRKVKFLNEVQFGDLELDFLNSQTRLPYQNIVFVGDNGVGKTNLLRSLKEIISSPTRSYIYRYIEYELNGRICRFERKQDDALHNHSYQLYDAETNSIFMISPLDDDYPVELRPRSEEILMSYSNNDHFDQKDDDFSSLIDRLVNLQNEDSINYAYYNIKHDDAPLRWSEFFQRSKMKTFADSFNAFFEDMEYFGMGFSDRHEKVIGFTKHGKQINTQSLSSGEKQIIERTVPILEIMTEQKDNLLFIDEPEMSLHPKWQEKVHSYFKQLFTDTSGIQQNQIFMASHSSAFLKKALMDETSLVVRLINHDGRVEAQRIDHPTYLSDVTFAEVNYLVFDIVSAEYHNQLYCQIQNRYNLSKVKACDEYIYHHQSFISNLHQKTSGYGRVQYNTICSYIRNAIDHFDNGHTYTEDELRCSIQLMQEILR